MLQTKQPLSEIMNMPLWKFEELIDRLNRRNKEQEDRRRKEEQESKAAQASQMSSMNPSSFMSKFNMPKF